MNIEFLSTVAVITPDTTSSRRLYVEALGLPLEGQGDGYHHSEQIAGCRSFGIWPLSQAAQACFGTDEWPAGRPVPQVSIEFDVAGAAAVAVAPERAGRRSAGLRLPDSCHQRRRTHESLAQPPDQQGCRKQPVRAGRQRCRGATDASY
jgi:hypothetical protein